MAPIALDWCITIVSLADWAFKQLLQAAKQSDISNINAMLDKKLHFETENVVSCCVTKHHVSRCVDGNYGSPFT